MPIALPLKLNPGLFLDGFEGRPLHIYEKVQCWSYFFRSVKEICQSGSHNFPLQFLFFYLKCRVQSSRSLTATEVAVRLQNECLKLGLGEPV